MNRKKAILIVLIIIGFFALVGLGTFLFGNKSGTSSTAGDTTTGNGLTFRDFLPWSNNDAPPTTPTLTDISEPDTTTPIPTQSTNNGLKKISNRHVVAAAVVETSTSVPSTDGGPDEIMLTKAVRYIERSTGNVFEMPLAGGEEKRISSTRIPEIYEGAFADKGQSVIFRYVKEDNATIETFTGKLSNQDIEGSDDIKGAFLPEGITSLAVSPDTSKVFYLTNFGAGAIGTTSLITGDKKVDVWKHSFTEWLTQWPSSKTITVTTKPSTGVAGFMYALNSTTGLYTKVLGNVPGLTTLMSPDEKHVLYSSSSGTGLTLNLMNSASQTTNQIPLPTLPEKCVWSKGSASVYCAIPEQLPVANYPDAWYKGLVSFHDQIVTITLDGKVTPLGSLAAFGGGSIDAINLSLDDDEQTLFFINKNDSILWSLAVNSSSVTQ